MVLQVNHARIIIFDYHITLFPCSLMAWHDTMESGASDGYVSEISNN
jgi:hypothetical protein